MYNPINTRLIKEAKKHKLEYISGLEMFIEQAKASFEIWFQIKPEVNKNLIINLKKRLNSK